MPIEGAIGLKETILAVVKISLGLVAGGIGFVSWLAFLYSCIFDFFCICIFPLDELCQNSLGLFCN